MGERDDQRGSAFAIRGYVRVLSSLPAMIGMVPPLALFVVIVSGAGGEVGPRFGPIFAVLGGILLGWFVVNTLLLVVTLLPRRMTVERRGLVITAFGRTTRLPWEHLDRIGHPAVASAPDWLVAVPAAGVPRPARRLVGFPSWHRRSREFRLFSLKGWNAPREEILAAIGRHSGHRYGWAPPPGR